MSARIDHAAKAMEWLTPAEGVGLTWEETTALADIAQVHATLALVEQKRIANMQFERAMLWQRSGRRVGEDADQALSEARVLDTLIREGVGL